jgi:hypothetical protein
MPSIETIVKGLTEDCAYYLSGPVYQSAAGKSAAVKHIALDLGFALKSLDVLVVHETDEWFTRDFMPTLEGIPEGKTLEDLEKVLYFFLSKETDMNESRVEKVANFIVLNFPVLA